MKLLGGVSQVDPWKWQQLGIYNSERARGIQHTPEWQAKMAIEQERFDAERNQRLRNEGFREAGDGFWLKAEA